VDNTEPAIDHNAISGVCLNGLGVSYSLPRQLGENFALNEPTPLHLSETIFLTVGCLDVEVFRNYSE
jgi:hypothetical protein